MADNVTPVPLNIVPADPESSGDLAKDNPALPHTDGQSVGIEEKLDDADAVCNKGIPEEMDVTTATETTAKFYEPTPLEIAPRPESPGLDSSQSTAEPIVIDPRPAAEEPKAEIPAVMDEPVIDKDIDDNAVPLAATVAEPEMQNEMEPESGHPVAVSSTESETWPSTADRQDSHSPNEPLTDSPPVEIIPIEHPEDDGIESTERSEVTLGNTTKVTDKEESSSNDLTLQITSVTGADETTQESSKRPDAKSEGENTDDLEPVEGKDKDPQVVTVDSHAGSNSNDVQQTIEGQKANLTGETSAKAAGKQPQTCIVCLKVGKCKYNIVRNGDIKHLCDDSCFKTFRKNPTIYLRHEKQAQEAAEKTPTAPVSTAKISSTQMGCSYCQVQLAPGKQSMFGLKVDGEMKPFCKQSCMEEYQKRLKLCANCNREVRLDTNSFMAPIVTTGGTTFRDFCSTRCHTNFSNKMKNDTTNNDDEVEIVGSSVEPPRKTRVTAVRAKCAVCGKLREVKHEVNFDGKNNKLCSETCFAAFRYANKLAMNHCSQCGAFCVNEGSNPHSIQFEGQLKRFCSVKCVSAFKVGKTKVQPCAWCGTKKHNFDMIERVDANNKYQLFCSLSCLSLYRVNLQATSNQSVTCDHCKKVAPAQYHLTMSDASVRNFCMYSCVMAFQAQFNLPSGGKTPTRPPAHQATGKGTSGNIKYIAPTQINARQAPSPTLARLASNTRSSPRQVNKATTPGSPANNASFPVISNVVSLAGPNTSAGRGRGSGSNNATANKIQVGGAVSVGSQIIIQPPPPKSVKNKSLLCKPFVQTKATSCRPHTVSKETQTEELIDTKQVLIPVPVPIYVPVPMAMYNTPQPYPLPIPIPIPVPCFIPTTKNSADSILKQIKEIQERMPSDPFEAELLMMAEAVASAEKSNSSGSDTEIDEPKTPATYPALPVQSQGFGNNTNERGEDMLQIALRMAEMPPGEDTSLDLEDSLAPTAAQGHASAGTGVYTQGNAYQSNYQSYIKETPDSNVGAGDFGTIDQDNDVLTTTRDTRSGWRGKRRRGRGGGGGRNKRARIEHTSPVPEHPAVAVPTGPSPDANMVLKYTYGVNAWKHWVLGKNAQLEQASSGRSGRLKLFKTEIMQCSADELNYSLCLFVKEVRKPSGEAYAPDSIYYLCLGIQQYLFENGRIDNIFTDFYYEKFTECLNEVLQRYEVRLNTQGLIVCRIEEEHLWESKQLGAHSPHVLLNTLIYFNTKFFHLRTPEDHLRLSFSHIMKHWKKTNIPGTKTPGRSVYLRYYAPVNSKESSSKRKREEVPVYEQGENAANPLRCPVKLYEFYLSKCVFSSPESIKNRNDVFYLVPERSCVPDSPVWYSTASLGVEAMTKMLNRVRVVREIQEAHLHIQLPFS